MGLVVRFQGWRWPLRDGDAIEVWSGLTLLGVVPAALLRHWIGYHLATTEVQSAPEPRKPLAPLPPHRTPEGRAALRQRRQGRAL